MVRFSEQEYQAYLSRRGSGAGQADFVTAPDAVEEEDALHTEILAYCKAKAWACVHSSMAHKTKQTLGTPDFIILADKGRTFYVECKSRTGKLRPDQIAFKVMAENQGHKVHIVTGFSQFMQIVEHHDEGITKT